MNASYWIEKLNLLPHPEGGYYRETYRCEQVIKSGRFDAGRNVSTAIYFLLERKNKSHFHRIKSDELWFFHEGYTLEILVLTPEGLQNILLGKNADQGESLQAVIPAGHWFAARIKNENGFGLVSCTVAPGFDFRDFELAKKEEMKKLFPGNEKLIDEMCLE
jgi:uncharacterized protein